MERLMERSMVDMLTGTFKLEFRVYNKPTRLYGVQSTSSSVCGVMRWYTSRRYPEQQARWLTTHTMLSRPAIA